MPGLLAQSVPGWQTMGPAPGEVPEACIMLRPPRLTSNGTSGSGPDGTPRGSRKATGRDPATDQALALDEAAAFVCRTWTACFSWTYRTLFPTPRTRCKMTTEKRCPAVPESSAWKSWTSAAPLSIRWWMVRAIDVVGMVTGAERSPACLWTALRVSQVLLRRSSMSCLIKDGKAVT